MSGSNAICVATVLLETGIVAIEASETVFSIEAPGGIVDVVASCRDGKAEQVRIVNVPSFADKLGASIEVDGIGTLIVDTAYGGDTFVVVDAASAGFDIEPGEARDLCETGIRITRAANEQLGFTHPGNEGISAISFCLFTGPVTGETDEFTGKNACIIRPGKVDRSPTGTGVSARLAIMHAKGEAKVGDTLVAKSIIGSQFTGRIEEIVSIGDRTGIRPSISGRAWITERRTLTLDARDPYPQGYRLSDTWPNIATDELQNRQN